MRLWVVGFYLAAVFGFAPARADDTAFTPTSLTASQVLAKARAARGAAPDGIYHRVVSVSGANGDTWQTETYENGENYIETVRDNGFDTASGSYHGTSWQQDENGTVLVDSGFHETANPFIAAVNGVTGASSGTRVLGLTQDAVPCIAIELKPDNGLVQRRFYDAHSYLLSRVETTGYDGLTYTYSYGDYRTAYGVTYAAHIAYADSHAENAWSAAVTRFEPVKPNAVDFRIPQDRPLFDPGSRPSVPIPADFTPNGIIVRVTVAGRGLDLELDSGASEIVIDTDVAQQLGLRVDDIRKATFSGDYAEGRTRIPDLQIGELHAHNVAIAAIHFERRLGERKVVGLLGGDFFSSGRINVDFGRSALTLLPSAAAAAAPPWVPIPIDVDDLVPRTHAKFNNVDGAFVVDLGADDTMLYPHFFRRFKPKSQGDVLGQVEGVAGMGVDYRRYTFSRFGLGSLEFADAAAMVPQSDRFEDTEYDGLLGRNILSNFNLLFDYAHRTLYVQSLVQ